jgi:hypothetical protein
MPRSSGSIARHQRRKPDRAREHTMRPAASMTLFGEALRPTRAIIVGLALALRTKR